MWSLDPDLSGAARPTARGRSPKGPSEVGIHVVGDPPAVGPGSGSRDDSATGGDDAGGGEAGASNPRFCVTPRPSANDSGPASHRLRCSLSHDPGSAVYVIPSSEHT